MGNFFNNGSMTMTFHILYDLESHAKDGRSGLSRNEDIRRFVGKWVEKRTLKVADLLYSNSAVLSININRNASARPD